MNCWAAQTRSIAARISSASGWYCNLRSSSGTCMATLVAEVFNASSGAVAAAFGIPSPSRCVMVILAEPLDELPHPRLYRRPRRKAHVGDQIGDVGVGLGDVARLQWQQVGLRLASETSLR